MTKLAMACVAAGALSAQPSQAATPAKKDDAALSAMLVGTWVNPPDSADYEAVPSKEVFNADGTYTYTEFEDNTCSRVSAAISSKWYVWDGTLVVEFPDGKSLKDEIVNMAPKKMVLRSIEDSLVYHRVRSEKCFSTAIKAKSAVSKAAH
jgi:hypothetical protein